MIRLLGLRPSRRPSLAGAATIRHGFSSSSSAAANNAGLESVNSQISQLKSQLDKQQDMLTQIMIKLSSPSSVVSPIKGPDPSPSTPATPSKKTPRGFLDFSRKAEPYRPPRDRARDWSEINKPHDDPSELKRQVARCMDCGTPFCQTNTGRVCPAPCEGACVAGVNDPKDAVTIKNSEYAIVDHAFRQGWIKPRMVPASLRSTGKRVGIVGSGPAGLAAADQLNQLGHDVTVYEREDAIGGLLQYGIPTMKLSKDTVLRRVKLLEQEGIKFKVNRQITSRSEMEPCDAVLLAVGASKPRDLNVPGRELAGVYFAMDFLTKNQKDLKPDKNGMLHNTWGDKVISVLGKDVVVIGGGDTGTDCIGTSVRQMCKSLVNLELMARPPDERALTNPWPSWPRIFKTDYGHAEVEMLYGQDPRRFSLMTTRLIPDATKTKLRAIQVVKVQVGPDGKIIEVPNSTRELPCDVVILAMGFVGAELDILKNFNLKFDAKTNIQASFESFETNQPGVFAAGDCRRGQSLVVWGIREGRDAAAKIHQYLGGL